MQNLKNIRNAGDASKELDNLAQSDPFKINNFAKAERVNSTNTKSIYFLAISIPLLLVISFLFFMIASMDGAMFGTPEDEMDSIISDRMGSFISSVDRDSGGALTGRISDSMDKIQLGLKIVPNMDQHAFLLKRMNLVGGPNTTYDGLESSVTYNWDALGDMSLYPYF